MTHREAMVLAAAGLLAVTVGVTWLAGPWGLIGSGIAIVLLALLTPTKERHGEPVLDTVPPPDS